MDELKEALLQKFRSFRIVFWYDEKQELLEDFNNLTFEDVKKIHISGNEFEVKHIVSKQEPEQKFLLYFDKKQPNPEDNWLLDLQLAHTIFYTDQEAMFLQEMGLGYHLKELVSEHFNFFTAKERRNKLVDLLGEGDEHQEIKYKMLAVLFNTENSSLVTYIHSHATAFTDENDKFEKELVRFNLKDFYWKEIERKYKYISKSPSIYDFLIEVFNSNFCLGANTGIAKESRLLLAMWRDTIQFRNSFDIISNRIGKDLGVESKLDNATIEEVVNDDLFKLTDLKIISDLVKHIANNDISLAQVNRFIKIRENKFWYSELESIYQSLECGAECLDLIGKYSEVKYESFQEGVKDYAEKLFEVDYYYRKFIYYFRKSNQNKVLADLERKIEQVYSNTWLLTYNNNWQRVIDKLETWDTKSSNSQNRFFETSVYPVVSKKQRLFVIISDALRYECGHELSKRLLSENRYDSEIDYLSSSLPSYTQLGMASLLPHKELQFNDNSDTILVDGMSSSGVDARAKILSANSGVRATAIQAEAFMKLNTKTEGRDFVKDYDLIYIYSNRIDKVGDDKTTEDRVFEAVEDEIQYLMDLMKKIANVNGNNMIITSDHGFIYQHNILDQSDFSLSSHSGKFWKESRRFVIGKELKNDQYTKAFKADFSGINSDVDILIPKSINRLRIKGAGAKFVHGGASMQEIVIPLIKVSKKRLDTTTQVDIDIIKSTDRITTNILAVSFIQSNLVTEKVLPRTIKAGIYADDGELLSDLFKYEFDIEEGSERQREVKHRFQLSSKSTGKYKNQRVKLVLEEPVEGSSKWKAYKDYAYSLNISFTNDFDEF
jgi:uncharacterized protein (TIGR02687 family)